MIIGATRKSGRVLPKCIKQVDVNKNEDLARTCGTLKVADLVRDANSPGIISMSLYEGNALYLMSVYCEEIKRLKKERKIFDKCNRRWLMQRSIESK